MADELTAAPTAFATSKYFGLRISLTPAMRSAMMILPPPTRMSFASPCLVLTKSMASSTARAISSNPEILISCVTAFSVCSFIRTRSVAYSPRLGMGSSYIY